MIVVKVDVTIVVTIIVKITVVVTVIVIVMLTVMHTHTNTSARVHGTSSPQEFRGTHDYETRSWCGTSGRMGLCRRKRKHEKADALGKP
jgi:hypothetical protein